MANVKQSWSSWAPLCRQHPFHMLRMAAGPPFRTPIFKMISFRLSNCLFGIIPKTFPNIFKYFPSYFLYIYHRMSSAFFFPKISHHICTTTIYFKGLTAQRVCVCVRGGGGGGGGGAEPLRKKNKTITWVCVYFVGCLNLIATETFWVASLSQMLVLCRQHAYFLCVGLWETKFHIMIGYKGFYRSCQIPIQSASTKTWNLWLSHIKRRFWTKIERRRSWWHRDLWESYRGSRAVPECIFLS